MEIEQAPNQSTTCLNESNTVSSQICSGELILNPKQGRSKVWEVFAKIVNKDGVETKKIVCCRNCQKILRFNNNSTSNLVKHKCYVLKSASESGLKVEVDEATKTVITKLITKWVITNCRPYNVVTDDGLQAVLQEFALIGAKYGANVDVNKALPHPSTVSRNVADFYEQCLKGVKEEVALVKENGFGLTTDIWTDNYFRQSYIALTIHFLKNGVLSVRLLGLKLMEGESCKSENIFKKVQKLLTDFGIYFSFKSIIVTDRSTNMKKAFRNTQHLACVSHLLNNTLQKAVEEVAEVAELTNCCAKLVKYFKKSGLNANLATSLKSYCPTRWNTVHYMLSSIEKNWDEINHILQSKIETHRIDSIDINCLKAVTKTLQPFEDAINALEGEYYATLHLVLIYLHQLKIACEANGCDLDLVQSLKEKLRFYLETIVMNNITIFHKIAVFLYPPTNKCSDAEKQYIEDECVRLLKCYQNGIPTIPRDAHTSSSPVSKHKKLFLDFVEPERHHDTNELVIEELQLYKNTRVVNSADFNVFHWREQQKNYFPLLYKLSCVVLATPASSASSERIFSAARNLLSEKRSALSLNQTGINQIIFVYSNVAKGELGSKF